MGWTQAEVREELARQGIAVNDRRLTDWRQKGLLPDLEEVRDAHGRVSYVWNQANIVAQVKTVAELFACYGRAHRFAHLLWLLGYEVRPELVMQGLRDPLVSMWHLLSGGIPADEQRFDEELQEQLLDSLSVLAIRMTWRRDNRPSEYPNRDDAADRAYRSMSLMTDPSYPAEQLITDLATYSRPTATYGATPDITLVQAVEFVQRHITPRRLAEVASTATWEEFSEAGTDFGLLRDIVARMSLHEPVGSRMRDLNPAVWTVLRDGALAAFGPMIICGDIALRRAGYGRHVRLYLRLFRQKLGTSSVVMAGE